MSIKVGLSPMWWDRDLDDQGNPIRADVRQAAHALWPNALQRVERTLFNADEAAELIESAVVHISQHLDRTQTPAFAANVFSLLNLHFSQELRRHAGRMGRLILVGHGSDIEEYAVTHDWSTQVDNQIDIERVIGHMKAQCRTIIVMRLHRHEWSVIGDKIGVQPSTIRKIFWRCMRQASLQLEREGSNK
jgi:DNA-directed RNA polymerase specialized sigma24 family protein